MGLLAAYQIAPIAPIPTTSTTANPRKPEPPRAWAGHTVCVSPAGSDVPCWTKPQRQASTLFGTRRPHSGQVQLYVGEVVSVMLKQM